MIDRPETALRIGAQRVEALRADADRVRLLHELPDELRVPAWRVRIATFLRGLADRLAPAHGPARGVRPGASEPLSVGGPPPC